MVLKKIIIGILWIVIVFKTIEYFNIIPSNDFVSIGEMLAFVPGIILIISGIKEM